MTWCLQRVVSVGEVCARCETSMTGFVGCRIEAGSGISVAMSYAVVCECGTLVEDGDRRNFYHGKLPPST